MVGYVGRVWKCRYFWLSLVRNDLRNRYRRSFLGIGWSLLQPIAMTTVLCLVFHAIFNMEITSFAPFLMSGLAFWSFFAACTVQGSHTFFTGEPYIRQYPAPMAIYPLRTALGAGFHFLLALGVVIAMIMVMQGRLPDVSVLPSLIPTLLVMFVLGWSVATILGCVSVHFPDTSHLSEVALQIWFYATPVMYPPEELRKRGTGWLIDYNPLVVFIDLIREPLLKGLPPTPHAYAVALTLAAMTATAAVVILAKSERTLVFHL